MPEVELQRKGLAFRSEVTVPLRDGDLDIGRAYRADIVVQDTLLLEINSVAALLPLHTSQVLTYLRLLDLQQGLLINFNVPRLVDGIRSVLR